MRQHQLDFAEGFRVACTVREGQAAVMTIAPRDGEGGPDNRHRGADQWLYVVEGEGTAVVEDTEVPLRAGTLLVIEHGERHEIRNDGDAPLRTLNFYYPPAFDRGGDPVGPGKG
ncbi:MAG TPA: cupin domain-containing protein [Xanthomonadaceae bacterium]|jgi:mannose-6-phosphate isomerase-like protein (cupin superfamily)|nr:cupin domain-containing protein [Xanthomonadaceae bacterium]